MKTIQTTYCKRFDNSGYHHQCIANRPIEDLDLEPDLITSFSFVILEHLHTLRKNFENAFQKTLTTVRG